MSQHTSTHWSEGLREATLHGLRDVPPVTLDGRIHMKHIDGRFGSFHSVDLLADTYVLHVGGSDHSISFLDADAVIAAGWAID